MLENIKKLSIALFIAFLLNIWGAVFASGASEGTQERGFKRTFISVGMGGNRSAFMQVSDYMQISQNYIKALSDGSLEDVKASYTKIKSIFSGIAPYTPFVSANPLLVVYRSVNSKKGAIANWLIEQAYKDACDQEGSEQARVFNASKFIKLLAIEDIAVELNKKQGAELQDLVKASLRQADKISLERSEFNQIFKDAIPRYYGNTLQKMFNKKQSSLLLDSFLSDDGSTDLGANQEVQRFLNEAMRELPEGESFLSYYKIDLQHYMNSGFCGHDLDDEVTIEYRKTFLTQLVCSCAATYRDTKDYKQVYETFVKNKDSFSENQKYFFQQFIQGVPEKNRYQLLAKIINAGLTLINRPAFLDHISSSDYFLAFTYKQELHINAEKYTNLLSYLCGQLTHKLSLSQFLYRSYESKARKLLSEFVEKVFEDVQENEEKKEIWATFFAMNSEKKSFLHYAVYFNWHDIVKILSTLVDPNVFDENNQSPLYQAVINGDVSMVELLLSFKRSVDCSATSDWSLIMEHAKNFEMPEITLLLQDYKQKKDAELVQEMLAAAQEVIERDGIPTDDEIEDVDEKNEPVVQSVYESYAIHEYILDPRLSYTLSRRHARYGELGNHLVAADLAYTRDRLGQELCRPQSPIEHVGDDDLGCDIFRSLTAEDVNPHKADEADHAHDWHYIFRDHKKPRTKE